MNRTILIDMDGVLADFDAHVYTTAAELGIEFPMPQDQNPHRYSTDCLSRRDRKAIRARINKPGWFADLPVVPGAIEGMEELCVSSWDVWICTKPLEDNYTCRDDKASWLDEHFGHLDLEPRLIIAPDKTMVRADALLDDAPKFDLTVPPSWAPIVYKRPFNGDHTEWHGLPRWEWGMRSDELRIHAGEYRKNVDA